MYNDRSVIITPLTNPNHHAVGRYFKGWDGQVYYCDSYQYGPDYGMVNVVDRTVRKEVSSAAINRTYHEVGTQNRPALAEEVQDRQNYAVDTLVEPTALAWTVVEDAACLGLPHSTALFCSDWDAERFIRIIQKAATDRAAELAAKMATIQ
jgi:hypothetical protein